MRKWLKDIRGSKGLTQEQVAILSGISRSHYTHIEQGTKTPSVKVAKRIASALNFDWTIFFLKIKVPYRNKNKLFRR